MSQPLDLAAPFTTREFRAAGYDTARLRTRDFTTVFRDVHVLASMPVTTLLRARAALKLAGPHAHVSHTTAAEIYDLAPPGRPGIDVTTPAGITRTRTEGVRSHLGNPECTVVVRHGLRMSSPVQAFLDLAGVPATGLVDLAIVGDRILAKGLATHEGLVAAADAWHGRGARLARRVARLCRPGVDSPMETRLRLLIVLAGLPEPEVNHVLRHPDGEWWLRLDLSYPDHKVLVEYDGRQHATSTSQWRRDIQRRELLEQWQWRTVTVTAEGIFDEPAETLRRVLTVLRERGVPGCPRRPSERWQQHYATR